MSYELAARYLEAGMSDFFIGHEADEVRIWPCAFQKVGSVAWD